MIQNKEKLRERFLRDPLSRRVGALAATFGRISSTARESADAANVTRLKAGQNKEQRTLPSVQAKDWSDRAIDFSGLLE